MAQPQLITSSMAFRCLRDSKFMELLPEFTLLMHKLNQNKSASSGCSSCAKRRAQKAVGGDFIRLVASLGPDRLLEFKKYLGTDKIMFNTIDPATRVYRTAIK